ncbi:family A G protein-coupled receptor-like protein [Calocera cornea HHB12733]|uniref:Family A G protein-coupled receptor-like protein n=1 Tax=Calocera cornea HHB12733 TaxID=1353952 RepID=A0A165CKI2_9BASI|nr:family A G protein-coupled receptor-like protein [Calocera cornea HHB12733]
MHAVADMLTAVADAVLASPTITGTASIPEPISPIPPTPTHSPPHRGPAGPGHDVTGELIGHFAHVLAWVVFGIYALAFLGFLFSAVRKPLATKLLPLLLLAVSIVGGTAYFSFATGLGSGFVLHAGADGVLSERQVWFGHYLAWTFTTPLLLSTLGTFAGLPPLHILLLALAGAATEIFSAIGTAVLKRPPRLSPHHHHHHAPAGTAWAWLVFSLLPFLYIAYTLLYAGRQSASLRPSPATRLYTLSALFQLSLFLPYPIILVLGDYLGLLSPTAEFAIFAALDVFPQVLWGTALLLELRRHPQTDIVLPDAWLGNAAAAYAYEPVLSEEPAAAT